MNVNKDIILSLEKKVNAEKAAFFPKYFKTGPGEYAEGDQFMGVTVPNQRKIARIYYNKLSPDKVAKLLQDRRHECRLTALFILVLQYDKCRSEEVRQQIVDIYLNNIDYVNNWDLVDSSAYHILGRHLWNRDRTILYDFAKSGHFWKERISIISTLYFIRKNDLDDTLNLAHILLNHPHDLIHKAVGWMLREAAKKDMKRVTLFFG